MTIEPTDRAVSLNVDDLMSLRRRISEQIGTLAEIARGAHHMELADRLDTEATRLEDVSAAKVLVVGETKRGKSSLINALVGTQDLMPVDFDVATGVHTVVGYSPEPYARVHRLEQPLPEPVSVEAIGDWITVAGNPDNRKGVKFVEVGIPSEFLERGVVLIDTPGVGGLDPAHARVTTAVLAEADALIFALEARSPISRPELEFLRTATSRIQSVLFVLTKVDQYPDYPVILMEDRRLLEGLGPRFLDIDVAPISAKLALRALKNAADSAKSKRDAEKSGVPELQRKVLDGVVARTRTVRLANALRLMDVSISLLDQWFIQVAAAASDGGTKAAAEEKMAEQRQFIESVRNWQRDLSEETGEARAMALALVQDRLAKIRANYEIEIATRYEAARHVSLAKDVEKDLRILLGDAADTFQHGLTEAIGSVVVKLGLAEIDLAAQGVKFSWRETASPRPLADLSANTKFSLGQKALMSGASGGLLGTVFAAHLGALFMPAVVAIGAFGAALQWFESKRSIEKQEAQRLLSEMISTWQRDVQAAFDDHLRAVRRQAEEHISRQIQERSGSLQAQIAALKPQLAADDRSAEIRTRASNARQSLARSRQFIAHVRTTMHIDDGSSPVALEVRK